MKKIILSLVMLYSLNLFSQNEDNFEKKLIRGFFDTEVIEEELVKWIKAKEYILLAEDSTPYYQRGYSDQFLIPTKIKSVKDWADGRPCHFKLKAIIDERLKVNAVLLYKKAEEKVYIEKYFIREKMWPLSKNKALGFSAGSFNLDLEL